MTFAGGHAVTIYGYSTGKGYSNVWVYDPWDNRRHTSIKSAVMYNAGVNDHELVW
jgi:hypothetical protein